MSLQDLLTQLQSLTANVQAMIDAQNVPVPTPPAVAVVEVDVKNSDGSVASFVPKV